MPVPAVRCIAPWNCDYGTPVSHPGYSVIERSKDLNRLLGTSSGVYMIGRRQPDQVAKVFGSI